MPRGKTVVGMVTLAALLLAIGSAAGTPANPSSGTVDLRYHARIPLGAESFTVEPWKSTLTVLASAESPQFEGWRREGLGDKRGHVRDAAGQPVRHFPDEINFRITLSTRTRLSATEPHLLEAGLQENDYLLRVRFRVKIFHGLQQTIVEPVAVRLIGVPGDIPYDERIYRATFDVGKVSLDDRIVLEVLTPIGERLCKFHLDLT